LYCKKYFFCFSFIEKMDKVGAYCEDTTITPPFPAISVEMPSKRRHGLRTILGPEPSDPTGMSIVATSATAVRVGEVTEGGDEDGDDRLDV
jgi:hypothetical protein